VAYLLPQQFHFLLHHINLILQVSLVIKQLLNATLQQQQQQQQQQ
jgi:hypothetical protein